MSKVEEDVVLRLFAPVCLLGSQAVKLAILSGSTLSLQTLNLALFADRQWLLQVDLAGRFLVRKFEMFPAHTGDEGGLFGLFLNSQF